MKLSNAGRNPISQLTKPVTVHFSDDPSDTLTASVRKLGLSEGAKEKLTNAETYKNVKSVDEVKRPVAEALVELVVSWDAQQDDGTPLPLDVDQLVETQSLETLFTVVYLLLDAWRADPLAQGTSRSSANSVPTAQKPRKSSATGRQSG